MNPVFVELSENRKRIEVWFRYERSAVSAIKMVSGAVFVPEEKSYNGAPHWTVPLDISVCRQLRRFFGDRLSLGSAIVSWAKEETARERQLKSIASAGTAQLSILPSALPKLYEAIHIGPKGRFMTEEERALAMKQPASFQAADVAFMVSSPNPLNGNHPGLGKTLETIATIFESGLDDGPVLVVSPKSSLEATWLCELEQWQGNPVYVSTGAKKHKQAAIESFDNEVIAPGFSGWLVVNPDQVRFREDLLLCEYHGAHPSPKSEIQRCPECQIKLVSEFPTLHETDWSAIIIDECHKGAVRNPKTLTAKGMFALKVRDGGKKIALTGTPMGGKIINLWGILHYLNPKTFSSKWRWAEMWTDVSSNGYAKEIGNSIRHCPQHFGWSDDANGRPECEACASIEEMFYEMLAPYVVRRTKREVLPYLPGKQFVPLWVDFGSDRHRKQYEEFNRESQTLIDSMPVTAMSVLDEYTRLKQFAFGVHERRSDGKLMPTEDSGKLLALREKLEELGIWNGDSDEQAVISSQFREVADLVHSWLVKNGVAAAKITGKVASAKKRGELKDEFQAGKTKVMVMTTTAGGVSITLDRASNVFILDETWDPDDQEQLEDRCHRASRIHQVTVYYLRTSATIDELIADATDTKFARNVRVLDARRLLLKS